jgi:hypothetical protein
MTKDEGWRGQTLAQNEATYHMFLECCGDRPPSQYQRKDLAKFYDLLRGLPALYSKSKEWSQLSLAEIVERTLPLRVLAEAIAKIEWSEVTLEFAS